jgi:hypothetical protein
VAPLAALICAVAGCGTSGGPASQRSATTPAGATSSGPLARLSSSASRQLLAASTKLLELAEDARKTQLRALVTRYEGASDAEVRSEVLKQIANGSPEVVNRGQFGEPVSLNETSLHAQLGSGSAESPQATASRAIGETLELVRGATFATLVGSSTGAVGTLTGPETVQQVLDGEIKDLTKAGLSPEAGRVRRVEAALPSAPATATSAYANEIERVAHVANTATASAVSGEPAAGQRDGAPVEEAAQKVELSPVPTYAADVAAAPLSGDLKALAVSVGVVGAIPSRLALLNRQVEAVDKTIASVLVAVGTGPSPARHAAFSGRPVPLPEPPSATSTQTTAPSPASQCGTQNTEEFAAFNLSARNMTCSEAIAVLKTVKIENEQYQPPPEYECSSDSVPSGVEETTCKSGEHSFSWFLREP